MKDRFARRASLIVLGAMLLLAIPTLNAFAAGSITAVSPSAEPANVTVDLTITGSGFILQPTVTFGQGITVNSSSITDINHLAVNVTIAQNAVPGFRTVTASDALGTASCSTCFQVTAPPTVTGIAPSAIGIGALTKPYVITGTGFVSGATVAISGVGVTAAHPVVTNPTTITVDLTISGSAIPGGRNVTVTNPDNQFAACLSCLTVTPAPSATASGFTPAQRGQNLTSQNISIDGTGFTTGTTGTTVAFSGTGIHINSYNRVSSTSLGLNISTDAGAPLGPQNVTFTNPSDGGTSTCMNCFSITGPTTVTIATPQTVNGDIVATFSQPVGGVSSSNSYVRLTGQTTNLPTSVTCVNASGVAVSCSGGNAKKALLHPTSPITPGQQYTVHIAAGGTVKDFGGLTVAEATQDFTGGTTQQAESAASKSTWRVVNSASAYGGSYVLDHTAGATASYRFSSPFNSITWYTNIGPSYGIADLYVDGVLRATVNSYSSTTHYRAAFTVGGLPYSGHTLTIRVRGAMGSSHGSGTYVAVDGFKYGANSIYTPGLTYTWGTVSSSAASGGAYIRSDLAGSTTSFTFKGTAVEWDTVTSPWMGKASVYVDGVLKTTVDNYSSTSQYNVARTITGLSNGVHTIKIVVLGTHRSGAFGSTIAIDRWVVT